jgi:hypothetical protein
MDLTCHKCGFKADYLEFTYLCANECVFFRSEALEDEEIQMRELAYRLWNIGRTSDAEVLKEAKRIISKLSEMNLRWNIGELGKLLIEKQKELFL